MDACMDGRMDGWMMHGRLLLLTLETLSDSDLCLKVSSGLPSVSTI